MNRQPILLEDLGPVKVCPTCREEFPEEREFFYADPNGKNGLRSQCKFCVSAVSNAAKKRRLAA